MKRIDFLRLSAGFLALVLIVVVAAGFQRAEAPAGVKTFQVEGGGVADKFQGKVTGSVGTDSEPGARYITIDDRILVLMEAGGLRADYKGERGELIGSFAIGDRVEVYAERVSKDSYTLYGDNDYYIKALK